MQKSYERTACSYEDNCIVYPLWRYQLRAVRGFSIIVGLRDWRVPLTPNRKPRDRHCRCVVCMRGTKNVFARVFLCGVHLPTITTTSSSELDKLWPTKMFVQWKGTEDRVKNSNHAWSEQHIIQTNGEYFSNDFQKVPTLHEWTTLSKETDT